MTRDYTPQVGDRVNVDGTVTEIAGGDALVVSPSGRSRWHLLADLALIERPAPTLPTEPGTTGTATVRGVPGMRVFRLDPSYGSEPWISATEANGYRWHRDEHLTDFVRDVRMVQAPDDGDDIAWDRLVEAPEEPDDDGYWHDLTLTNVPDPQTSGAAEPARHADDAQADVAPSESGSSPVAPEPGLVERVSRELAGFTWSSDQAATRAALAVADWLDEQDMGYSAARIRREVEGGAS